MITPNEKLRRARLERHWSVAVASQRVGVSINTFNRWERGLQIPQMATLNQLLETFELPAEDLGFGFVMSPYRMVGCGMYGEEPEEMDVSERKFPELPASMLECPPSLTYRGKGSRPLYVQPPVQGSAEETERLSRRQAITTLISAPAVIFGVHPDDNLSLLRVEEILTLCASHIPLCWQLYFEGGRAELEQVLPNYITRLSTLACNPSSYQKRAASLLSQTYQLASLLSIHRQDYGAAYAAAQQGLCTGMLADDSNLQVASFIRQALVSFYLERPRPCLQSYQNALQLISKVTPLLQGRVYVGMAEASSKVGQEKEAWRYLEMAEEIFPAKPEDDLSYIYTHFTLTSVSTYKGIMHLNLNQPGRAWQTFAHIDRKISTNPVPNRLELLVHQTMAACSLGEIEQAGKLIELALPMARMLGSQLRSDQISQIYEQMLNRWGNEPVVHGLEMLFR